MGYPQGPYEFHSSLPVPPRPKWGPARAFDFTTRRYVIGPDGNLEHMPPTPQRVVLLVTKNAELPKFNTIQNRNKYRQDIRTVLQPLELETPPAIEILSIVVESQAAGGLYTQVKFRDLTEQAHPITEIQIP